MPVDFSRKLLDHWGGTLDQVSLGSTEEPEETEVTVPSALHVNETTAEIVDDKIPTVDTAPVANGAARKQGDCCLDVIGESTLEQHFNYCI
jgi:hypothetical protein